MRTLKLVAPQRPASRPHGIAPAHGNLPRDGSASQPHAVPPLPRAQMLTANDAHERLLQAQQAENESPPALNVRAPRAERIPRRLALVHALERAALAQRRLVQRVEAAAQHLEATKRSRRGARTVLPHVCDAARRSDAVRVLHCRAHREETLPIATHRARQLVQPHFGRRARSGGQRVAPRVVLERRRRTSGGRSMRGTSRARRAHARVVAPIGREVGQRRPHTRRARRRRRIDPRGQRGRHTRAMHAIGAKERAAAAVIARAEHRGPIQSSPRARHGGERPMHGVRVELGAAEPRLRRRVPQDASSNGDAAHRRCVLVTGERGVPRFGRHAAHERVGKAVAARCADTLAAVVAVEQRPAVRRRRSRERRSSRRNAVMHGGVAAVPPRLARVTAGAMRHANASSAAKRVRHRRRCTLVGVERGARRRRVRPHNTSTCTRRTRIGGRTTRWLVTARTSGIRRCVAGRRQRARHAALHCTRPQRIARGGRRQSIGRRPLQAHVAALSRRSSRARRPPAAVAGWCSVAGKRVAAARLRARHNDNGG